MSLPYLLLALVALSASTWAKPEDWAPREEEHWASAMCTELTTAQHHYANFNLACHECVDNTKGHGDPTRCHACLRTHQGHHHKPEALVSACLDCVGPLERKKLGWACNQYCTHHGIINDREQADACVECLKWDVPKDKWSCHVCMDQVDKDMVARNECYQCLKDGHEMYGCAWCGRTPKAEDRAKCWKCMAGGKTGKECAEPFGVLPYDGTKKL